MRASLVIRTLAVLTLLASLGTASARAGDEAPAAPSRTSPRVAVMSAIGATTVTTLVGAAMWGSAWDSDHSAVASTGVGLTIAGLVAGPYLGWHLVDLRGRGLEGMLARAALAGGVTAARWRQTDSGEALGNGAVCLLVTDAIDLALIGPAVRRHAASASLEITPWRPQPGADTGFALRVRTALP